MSWSIWGADNGGRESERVALEADERERFMSRSWLTPEEDFLLRQAHTKLCSGDRLSRTIRDRALAVVAKLGDADLVVEGKPLREHEPALIVAVALELARRWRVSAGDKDETRDQAVARVRHRAWLANAVTEMRPSPVHVTMSEIEKIVGPNVRQVLYRSDLPIVARATFRYVSLVDAERVLAARPHTRAEVLEAVRSAIAAARSQNNSVDNGAHGGAGDPPTGSAGPSETRAGADPISVDTHAHGDPRDAGTGVSSPAETGVRVDPISEEVAC